MKQSDANFKQQKQRHKIPPSELSDWMSKY